MLYHYYEKKSTLLSFTKYYSRLFFYFNFIWPIETLIKASRCFVRENTLQLVEGRRNKHKLNELNPLFF